MSKTDSLCMRTTCIHVASRGDSLDSTRCMIFKEFNGLCQNLEGYVMHDFLFSLQT